MTDDMKALVEWKNAILEKCKASDGFDRLKWGGDKSGWGFVHFFIGHLETRAITAEAEIARLKGERDDAVTEMVRWRATASSALSDLTKLRTERRDHKRRADEMREACAKIADLEAKDAQAMIERNDEYMRRVAGLIDSEPNRLCMSRKVAAQSIATAIRSMKDPAHD